MISPKFIPALRLTELNHVPRRLLWPFSLLRPQPSSISGHVFLGLSAYREPCSAFSERNLSLVPRLRAESTSCSPPPKPLLPTSQPKRQRLPKTPIVKSRPNHTTSRRFTTFVADEAALPSIYPIPLQQLRLHLRNVFAAASEGVAHLQSMPEAVHLYPSLS